MTNCKVTAQVSKRRQNIAPQFTVGFCDNHQTRLVPIRDGPRNFKKICTLYSLFRPLFEGWKWYE